MFFELPKEDVADIKQKTDPCTWPPAPRARKLF